MAHTLLQKKRQEHVDYSGLKIKCILLAEAEVEAEAPDRVQEHRLLRRVRCKLPAHESEWEDREGVLQAPLGHASRPAVSVGSATSQG